MPLFPSERIDMNENSHRWYDLDNAAIIIPGSVRGCDTRVFRLVCQLKEEVNPEILQRALDDTVPEFPYFSVALRKGLFWYYLDSINAHAEVEEDHLTPLAQLYRPGERTLLYRVTYYRNRINLEMFHVLADGTGAFIFFRRLIVRYLCLVHGMEIGTMETEVSSHEEKSEDAFAQYYHRESKRSDWKKTTKTKAYHIQGDPDPNQRSHLMEITVSAKAFVDLAHAYNTKVGVLITAMVIESIVKGMSVHDRQKKPVVISVPVNLRQYFPTESVRNFYGLIYVRYDALKYDGHIEPIIEEVKQQFAAQLKKEDVSKTMNSFSALAGNYAVKLVPILFKEPTLGIASSRSHAGVTGSVSNLERISMPEAVADDIDHFAAFMSSINFQLTIASYRDAMVFGFVCGMSDTRMMLEFCRSLRKHGLSVKLATNDFEKEGG